MKNSYFHWLVAIAIVLIYCNVQLVPTQSLQSYYTSTDIEDPAYYYVNKDAYAADDKDEENASYNMVEDDRHSPTSLKTRTNAPNGNVSATASASAGRPWMVVHVGPPKTGTTTIQAGLQKHASPMATLDNVFYLGQCDRCSTKNIPKQYFSYRDPPSNRTRTSKIHLLREFCPVPMKPFVGSLLWHRQEGHNIVMSSEHWTSRFPRGNKPRDKEKQKEGFRNRYLTQIFYRLFLSETGGIREMLLPQEPQPPSGENLPKQAKQRGKRAQQRKIRELYRQHQQRLQQQPNQKRRRRRRLEQEENGDEVLPETSSNSEDEDENQGDNSQDEDENQDADENQDEAFSQPPPSAFFHEESSLFAFDVKIVVTYRHYFQWLPSYYYQSELINHDFGAPSLVDFIETALRDLGDRYRQEFPTPLSPNATTTADWLETMVPTLDRRHGALFSYLQWSAPRSLRDRVEVFDMHQQHMGGGMENDMDHDAPETDLFADFLCQALPAADRTCSQLLAHQTQTTDTTNSTKSKTLRIRVKTSHKSVLETGILSDTLLRQMTSAARDRLPDFEDFRRKPKHRTHNSTILPTTVQFRDYPGIDPAQSIFTEKGRKITLRLRKNFMAWVKDRQDAHTHTPMDTTRSEYGQQCLSEASTRQLKIASWNMLTHLEALVRLRDERRRHWDATKDPYQLFGAPAVATPDRPLLLAPHKYKYHHGDDDTTTVSESSLEALRRRHDEMFDQYVERGAYCELDLDQLFRDESFLKRVFYTMDNVDDTLTTNEDARHD